jgi:hypothetical protein
MRMQIPASHLRNDSVEKKGRRRAIGQRRAATAWPVRLFRMDLARQANDGPPSSINLCIMQENVGVQESKSPRVQELWRRRQDL